jgi:hypothetical protein
MTLMGYGCSGNDAASKKTGLGTTVVGPSSLVSGSAKLDHILAGPTPAPSAAPAVVPGGSCPIGDGVANPQCASTGGLLLPQVEAAIDQVITQRPDLFDMNRVAPDGGYLVLNPDVFHTEMIARLQAMGLCSEYDIVNAVLQVKKDDTGSESYFLVSDRGYLRRGEGAYVRSCTPAAFPLAMNEIISYVRVGFYGIECYDGQEKPGNNDRKLPIDCFGLMTATPKNADGSDVDERLHGTDITWELTQADDYVDMQEDPEGNDFNKVMRGLDPGWFTLCATVGGVQACANFEVVQP